ncbi:MAG: OmpH family outer membrane protein [Geminicoccales bacterium]
MQRSVLVWLAALAAPLAVSAPALHAQGTAAAPRIAIINAREILQRTPGYAAAESTYLKEVEGFRIEVQKLQQQLDSAVQAFEQQLIALSQAQRRAREDSLRVMEQRMQVRTTQLQERARQREQELLEPIRARVQSVVEGLRAELNYALILDADAPGGMIFAADPALNITARVLQRLQPSR